MYHLTATVVIVFCHSVCCMPDLYRTNRNICLTNLNGDLCCGHDWTILWKILKQAIETYFGRLEETEKKSDHLESDDASDLQLRKTLQESYWEMKPYARLVGVPIQESTRYEHENGLFKIPSWQDGNRLWSYEAFVENGLAFRDGSIIVSVSGIYRIYSNVHLQAPYIEGTGCPNITESKCVKHAISKYNILDGNQTELTSTAHLPRNPQRSPYRCSFFQSYIETITYLNSGDEVSVFVSDLKNVRYPDMNYFGVTMI